MMLSRNKNANRPGSCIIFLLILNSNLLLLFFYFYEFINFGGAVVPLAALSSCLVQRFKIALLYVTICYQTIVGERRREFESESTVKVLCIFVHVGQYD